MKYLILLLFVLVAPMSLLAIGPITGTGHTCIGSSTALTDATPGGIWSSSNVTIATVSSTGLVTGVTAGSSVITYTVGAGYVITTVVIYPLPALFSITGGGGYCAGDTGVHVGLSGSQTGVNYSLHVGVSVIGLVAGTGGVLDFGLQTTAGTYTVVATNATTLCSDTMLGIDTVTINPLVIPSVSIISPGGDTACSGSTTTFQAIAVNGGTTPVYQWNVNGLNVGTDSIHYTYVPANGDHVRVTLVSSAACASPDTVTVVDTITVLTSVVPSVTITSFPGTRVCQGAAVLLTPAPVNGGPAPAYRWTKDGTYVATGPTYTFIPVNDDIVHCTMTSDYRCRLADTVISPNVTITVDSAITPYISILASPGTTIGRGQFDTLTAIVTNGGSSITYQWFVNDVLVPGATTSTFISDSFSAPYPDSITCNVTGSGACMITAYTWVYIVVSSVGVEELANASKPTLWPNPATTELFVDHAAGADFIMSDMLGKVVLVKKLTVGIDRQAVDISSVPEGVYIVQIIDPLRGTKVTRKVIRQ